MTSHDQALALATERAGTGTERADATGALVKWAACLCDDGRHGFADRAGWVTTEPLAFEDWLATDPERAHVVIRVTDTVDEFRDRLIAALAVADGNGTEASQAWLRAMYGRTADVLVEQLGGAR